MNIKRVANHTRYNYYFSLFARSVLRPIQRTCGWIDQQIQMKIWVNGTTVTYDGVILRFPRNVGVNYCSTIWWKGVNGYEPNTWRVLRYFLQRAKHFLDVGSNIGFYSVLAKKVNPQINVDAFEPIPTIYQRNIGFHKANGLDSSRIWNIALGSKDGETEIYVPVDDTAIEETSAATLRQDSWQSRKPSSQRMRVVVAKLDTFLQQRDLALPMIIKIDVEDYEAQVLQGAATTIKTLKPIMICEMLPRAHGNIETYNFLEQCDYSAFGVCKNGLFRMMRSDLGQPRDFTDFLLLPNSAVSPEQNYIAFSQMDQIRLIQNVLNQCISPS